MFLFHYQDEDVQKILVTKLLITFCDNSKKVKILQYGDLLMKQEIVFALWQKIHEA